MAENLNNVIIESLKRIPLEQVPVAISFLSARVMTEAQGLEAERDSGIEELFTPKQLAKHLNVPESWVRSEQRSGRIPAVRLGKYVRFRRSEVEAALVKAAR